MSIHEYPEPLVLAVNLNLKGTETQRKKSSLRNGNKSQSGSTSTLMTHRCCPAQTTAAGTEERGGVFLQILFWTQQTHVSTVTSPRDSLNPRPSPRGLGRPEPLATTQCYVTSGWSRRLKIHATTAARHVQGITPSFSWPLGGAGLRSRLQIFPTQLKHSSDRCN